MDNLKTYIVFCYERCKQEYGKPNVLRKSSCKKYFIKSKSMKDARVTFAQSFGEEFMKCHTIHIKMQAWHDLI